jgi:hypothetical protein
LGVIDDDIFCIINRRKVDDLLKLLNSRNPAIKFTCEKENEDSQPFLDVKVTRDKSKLVFDIYQKPTNTQRSIPNTSSHPKGHKMAAYYSMLNRACTLLLPKDSSDKEIIFIKPTADLIGYPATTIDKILRKKTFIAPTGKVIKNCQHSEET